MSDKIVGFPGTNQEEPQEESTNEEWICKACGHGVTEESERKVLPINVGGNPQTGTPGITFYVCPNCYTLSMPEEMFEEIHRRMNSRIIQ